MVACTKALPRQVWTNTQIAKRIHEAGGTKTSDEKIRELSGIQTRHLVSLGETVLTLGTQAAQEALISADWDIGTINLLIAATTSEERFVPALAYALQQKLKGSKKFEVYHINAACSGFVSALHLAQMFFRAQPDKYKRILIVASEVLSRFINWRDRDTACLFADGAGAALLEARKDGPGIIYTHTYADGDDTPLQMPIGGYISMDNHPVFRFATRIGAQEIQYAVAETGIDARQLKIILHQANIRIIRKIADITEIPFENFLISLDKYGNTGCASIPICLANAFTSGALTYESEYLCAGVGGGNSAGASLFA